MESLSISVTNALLVVAEYWAPIGVHDEDLKGLCGLFEGVVGQWHGDHTTGFTGREAQGLQQRGVVAAPAMAWPEAAVLKTIVPACVMLPVRNTSKPAEPASSPMAPRTNAHLPLGLVIVFEIDDGIHTREATQLVFAPIAGALAVDGGIQGFAGFAETVVGQAIDCVLT